MLLITGGYRNGVLSSVEVWAPAGPDSAGLSCSLAPMMSARYGHSVTGSGLVCGGCGVWENKCVPSVSLTSCEIFSDGSWVLLENTILSLHRVEHSAWLQRSTKTTFLLGGEGSSVRRSVETVSSKGEVGQTALTLKHNVR